MKAKIQKSAGRGFPEKQFYRDDKNIEGLVRLAIQLGASKSQLENILKNDFNTYVESSNENL